jgi:hypothetical protein
MLRKKLMRPHIWRRILYERLLAEPMAVNLASALVAVFGSYRTKIAFDLIPRQFYAFGLLAAADTANRFGIKSLTALEFGVAEGTGLINIGKIAARLRPETGVEFKVFGFDSGKGMPPPCDYRDHPELYREGDFPMVDCERLRTRLPPNTHLILGELKDTVPDFARSLSPDAPLGFVSVDVDYFSSTSEALNLLVDPDPRKYLPTSVIYFDDIDDWSSNDWCGELLAIHEFNQHNPMRKLRHDPFLVARRVIKHAVWHEQVFLLHVLDHPERQPHAPTRPPQRLGNVYTEEGKILSTNAFPNVSEITSTH